MTPRQADKLIADGARVTLRSRAFDETFSATPARRDRRNLYTVEGGCFDRADLEVVNPKGGNHV